MSDKTVNQCGVLFDLDGVLLDSEGLYSIFWERMEKTYPTGIEHFASYIKGFHLARILRKKMMSLYRQHPEFPTLFDLIITGDMVTKAKPDPDCFLLGAKLMGMDIKDCIVFEDSRNGLVAGRASGARVIGVATTLSVEAVNELSDMTIDAMSQLSVEQMLACRRKG